MELKTEVREENTEKLDIVKINVSKSKDTSKKIKIHRMGEKYLHFIF
jgi:hypothetical protein